MVCYRPISGYRSIKKNDYGKRPIVYSYKDGYGDMVIHHPCGRCVGCRLERSRVWASRCVHENKCYDTSCFITLTYDNENLPSDMSLHKSEFQDFMKRLRDRLNYPDISYYMCGEYGDLTSRPHYHALIFGWSPPDMRLHQILNGHRIYTSSFLESIWGKGFCPIGNITFESAAYVARYVMKKITGDIAEAHYGGRLPEYNNMSLRPAIGKKFFDKYKFDIYAKDEIIINGHPCRPPRQYDVWFEKFHPDLWQNVYSSRFSKFVHNQIERAQFFKDDPNAVDDYGSTRLYVKEQVKISQVQQLLRSFE